MKSLKALFVLALAVVVSTPFAYAETQNVKVSGSIDAYWFYRNNYDLRDNNDLGSVPVTYTGSYDNAAGSSNHRSNADDFFRTNTQIEVSADLTDNVSTVINLVNQRDWNAADHTTGNESTIITTNTGANEFDVELDLAYVQMKEIFYSPLTLTIGRQDIWFGRGFIIGNNWRAWDQQNLTAADEYSVTTAFDAARATLDFNPWTLDFVYAKIDENHHDPEDDIDLYAVNVNYQFSEYNAVAEGYLVSEIDRAALNGVAAVSTGNNDTHTIGGRVQFDPISQITLGGELAYQMGNYSSLNPNSSPTSMERDRAAWAFDLFGTYRWDNTWKPEVTLEYVHFSGEDDVNTTGTSAEYNAWNGLYRGKFWTAYADFRQFIYGTADGVDQPATQNENILQVKGAMKPLEDLLLEASFSYFWIDEDVHTPSAALTNAVRDEELGYEVDFQVTYDYTEDVSFGFVAAWFVPGDFFLAPADSTATDLVSSVKVTF
jgi:hypothetical protein